jgi:RHS repeat-associated protein
MRRSLSICSIVVITVFLSFCPFVLAQDSGPANDGSLNGLFAPINPGSRLGSNSATPDLFAGAMNYAIPIVVPAGRKGIEPKIALTYRSSQQNGWLGLGWELEIGSVERNTKNGLDYIGDSYVLKMNGAGIDLVRVGEEYRAKVESGFLRIRASKDGSGRPIFWEVTDKTGTRYFYGQTSNTRQDDPADPNKVFKWCLERVEDANGNYMSVSYSKHDGQIYLEQIDYAGNGTMTPRNVVRFIKDAGSRLDAPVMYKTNFGVKTTYRLASIIVTADGNPLRSYKLTYTQSSETAQSLLQSVQQFGKDDVSTLPAVQMEYAPESKSFTSSKLWYQGSAAYPNTDTYWGWVEDQYRFGDFDGDGKADVLHYDTWGYQGGQMGCNSVALSNGSGFNRAECWSKGGSFNGDYGWRQSIPVSDFDGDGKTDFAYIIYGYYGPGLTNYVVGLSKGFGYGVTGSPNYTGEAGFGLTQNTNTWLYSLGWLTRSGAVWAYFRTADFNADGKTDVVYLGTNGALEVSLSTGSSFTTAAPWATVGSASLSRYRFADFSGDGKDDVLFIDVDGSYQVAVSTGSGFDTSSLPWGAMVNGGDSSRYIVGDYNGDGKADLLFIDSAGNLYVALATGSQFLASPTPWKTMGNGVIGYYRFGDFNGDGKTDVVFTGDTGVLSVMISTGSGFTDAREWGSLGYGAANGAWGRYTVADFSGDGRADVWYVKGSYSSMEQASFFVASSAEQPDNFLVRIFNGIGGKTDITYQQSTNYVNTGLPFPVQTVSNVKSDDGNGNVAETLYDYSGGYYHGPDREFRGFNRVTVTGPTGPSGERAVTETWFHQGNDTAVDENNPRVSPGYMNGKPYRTRSKDGAGKVYSETLTNYQSDDDATDGYFNPPNEIITYYCDGATAPCDSSSAGLSRRVKLYYDIYGNMNREEVYDSAAATSSYRTTQRIFTVENTSNYLVGYPAFETIYEGVAMTGNEVSSTAFYYDDPGDCAASSRSKNQLPTKGNVTTIARWLNTKPANSADPEVNVSYDSYGNMTCTREPKGNISRLSYDTDTYTYMTSTTNSKGHVKSTRYYGIEGNPADAGLYGQVQSATDPNLAVVTMEYDALGRKVRLIDPNGINSQIGTVSYFYHDNVLGSVGQQRITTYATTDYATQAYLWSESYFDGFGRTVKTRTQGPDSKVVAATTNYDVRGAISASSLPYFEGVDAPRNQTFKYDSRGRVTQITNPDQTIEKKCYSSGVTVVIDPEGRRKRETTDVFGRIVQIDEYDTLFTDCTTALATPYATTRYQHDASGSLRFVTDAENNSTEMRYDSLGRKYYMKEPNMGEWRYYYDANGNLEYQVDAKTQTIRYVYDQLNRLTLKDYPDDQDVTYTYDVAPDGVATTYSVGRLSTMADASGTVKFYYDKSGRAVRTIKRVDGTDYDFMASYDAMSRLTGITYPDSETVSYAYNEGGQLKSVSGSSINYATFSNYNALGQSGTIGYGNGVSTAYEYYSSNNRLKAIVTKSEEQRLIDLTYNYYSGGSIKDIVDNISSARSQSFWYDGLNRIQQAQSQSYGVLWYDYTVNGNIKMKEGIAYDYTGPKPHAVKSTSDGRGYEYDANGNMINERQGLDVYREIDYYNNNMPKSIAMGGVTTSFVYDGSGSRVKKTAAGIDQVYIGKLYQCSLGSCTKFIFAGDNRIAMKSGSEVYYYHQDHLGSTLVVTDSRVAQDFTCSGQPVRIAGSSPKYFPTLQEAYNAAVDGDVIQARDAIFTENLDLNRAIAVTISGGYNCTFASRVERSQLLGMLTSNTGRVTIENFEIVITGKVRKKVQDVQYLPFGSTSSDIGFVSVSHKFTSQEEDAETGLYYYNARYYNSRLGRFISADPTVPDPLNPQALNRYSYVVNDPLHYVDPSGYDYVPYTYIDFYAPSSGSSGSGGYPSFAFSSGGSSSSFGGSPSFMPNYSNYNNYVNYVNSMSARPSASSYVPSAQYFGVNSSMPSYSASASANDSWLQSRFSAGYPESANDSSTSIGQKADVVINRPSPRLTGNFIQDSLSGLDFVFTCVGNDLAKPSPLESVGPGASGFYSYLAWKHAATTPSKAFGTSFLVYPARSSVFRGYMRSAGRAGAAGILLTIDVSLISCLCDEWDYFMH